MQYFGENGIIKKAQQAKGLYENSVISEEEEMNTLLAEYENMMAEPPYEDSTLPTTPQLTTTGMTKVKWNGSNWVKVTDDSEKWYDYSSDSKQWANVVLGDATFNSDGTLDESKAYTQLVWIPRYAYQITSYYHTATSDAGNINIVFIDTNNKDKSGTTYSTTYPSATAGASTGMSDYVVHPAFDYGGTALAGFWMGKFESSRSDATSDGVGSGSTASIRAGVQSWRSISVGDIYSTCLGMKGSSTYGWTSSTTEDPHMCKNDEWGAVAYLSQSTYGKNSEVYINNSSSYITGTSGGSTSAGSSDTTYAYNTTNGVGASTTGNITGVYDMSGGAYEYVAAYAYNGDDNLTNYGGNLVATGTASKYRNVYAVIGADEAPTPDGSYALSEPKSTNTYGHYGDAIWETSESGMDPMGSWRDDCSIYITNSAPFFVRGGSTQQDAGVFFFYNQDGSGKEDYSFRVVIPVL